MATTPTRAVPGCAKKRVSTMSRKEKEMTINVWNYMRKIYPEETEESHLTNIKSDWIFSAICGKDQVR